LHRDEPAESAGFDRPTNIPYCDLTRQGSLDRDVQIRESVINTHRPDLWHDLCSFSQASGSQGID
jgi:hypothetical protein